jgi:PIN domain nuclease of toxin-antitoxin system
LTVFLDTHVAVYAYHGDPDLWSPPAVHMMEAATRILISPMVVLELQYLRDLGKISVDAGIVMQTLKQQFGMVVDEAGSGAAIINALSVGWTRDPFDRIITAHAILKNAYLLTRDQIIRDNCQYAVW